ncbi:MAG: hypothetical protein M9887_07675 [Chitinophagales bacterium]|nr:hypothetical protein [Chitinophagales bacterium]
MLRCLLFSKKLFACIVLTLVFHVLSAQISNLPYQADFSQKFILGNDDVEFIPNWLGNEVDVDKRIFQTKDKELAMIPMSSFYSGGQCQIRFEQV